jgi:hypothetical protein
MKNVDSVTAMGTGAGLGLVLDSDQRLKRSDLLSTIMVGFIDNVRSHPPCMVCGSSVIKENELQIDWIHGDWKGEWTRKMVNTILKHDISW